MKIGLCASKKTTAGLMSDNLYLFNMTFGRESLIMLTKSTYLCIHSTSIKCIFVIIIIFTLHLEINFLVLIDLPIYKISVIISKLT